MIDLGIQMDRLKIDMDRLAINMDRLRYSIEHFGSGLAPFAYEHWDSDDSDPLAPFEKKISLLLQHAERWRCFHIVAAQPLHIHHFTELFAMDGRKAPHLRELCLETSRSLREMSLTALAKRIPLFSSEVPSLQRLALCCDVPPVEFGPKLALPPSMFPGLSELELTKMGELDHSLCLRMLYGLPNLRILKVMDVKFGAAVVARRSQRVVLESLEELTLEDSNILMLEPLLRSLSTPNLRLLSCIKVE